MKLKQILKWPVIGFVSVITLLYLKFEKRESARKITRSPASISKKLTPLALVVPKPQTASTPLPIENREESVLAEITKLSECYEKNCSMFSDDPRTEYYRLGQALKGKLAEYNSYVTKNELKEDKVTALALQFLAHSDGHVQEVALDLLSTQETSEQSLEAILKYIIGGYDAELIPQSFLELQRYTHPGDQEKIRNSLAYALLHGVPFVATAISENISLLLNAENISYYKSLVSSLDPRSKIYQNLKFSIQEFDQLSQAG